MHKYLLFAAALACAGSLASRAPAQVSRQLTTTFATNNGGGAGWGVFFDLAVTNEKGVTIKSLEINQSSQLDIYTCPTTYVGNDTNMAAWTKVSSASVTGTGSNNFPLTTLTPPLVLTPATYGVMLYYVTGAPLYTNGTGTNQVYANSDLTVTTGIVHAGLFSSTLFTPRVWNGSIYYDVVASSASFRMFGAGCMGSNGVPVLDQAA